MAAVVRDVSGSLVVMGGLVHGDNLQALRTAEILREDGWAPFPSMNVSRCGCSGAVDSRGRIYVVGGGDNMYASSRAWSSIEVFERSVDPTGEEGRPPGRWRNGPAMGDARCALGVAYSSATDHLFAAGGYAGARRYLNTAERLDLSGGAQGAWEALPPLSCKRAGCNAAVGPDHRIYVLGGGPDGLTEHNTMEALDPREGRWHTDLAPLNVGRHYNAAAFGPDGCLYVAGTFRHSGQLDVVERYDPRANAWEGLRQIGAAVHFSAGAFLL